MSTGPGPETKANKAGIVSDSLAMGVAFALVLTIVGRGIGFLRGLIFCRIMTDQQLGQWSMIWSFLMLIAPLAVLGLPGSFGRFVEHYRNKGQLRTFVFRITAVSATATLAVTTAILLMPGVFSWLVFRDSSQTKIVTAIGFSLIFIVAMNFLTCLLEALRQVRLVTLIRFILGVGFFVISCSLMLVWKDMAAAATVGYGASCLIACLPAVWFLWKYRGEFVDSGQPLSHHGLWSRIAPFALWMWWCNICHNLFEAADRYMLIHLSPLDAATAQGFVGQYHSGRVLPLLLLSVSAVLAMLLMPYLSEHWEKGNKKQIRVQLNWTLKLIATAFTTVGAAMILFSPLLFDTFLQGRYDDGRAVLPLSLVYCIWMSLFILAQDYVWVREKGSYAFATNFFALLINIALNWFMIPTLGLWGAVIATTVANFVGVTVIYIVNHRLGCRTDFGIWLTLLLPLCLLMPQIGIVIFLAGFSIVAIGTQWIFSSEEKQQLIEAFGKLKARVGL